MQFHLETWKYTRVQASVAIVRTARFEQ